MRLQTRTTRLLAAAAVTLVMAWLNLTSDHAEGKGKPGGDGGGGSSKPYRLVDLGGFVGGDFVQAEALDVNNPDGAGVMQVAGYSLVPPGLGVADAAIWDVSADGQILDLTDIAPATSGNTGGRRVNDLGYVLVADLLWVPAAGYVTLPGLGSGPGIPRLMDDLGSVFGGALDANGIEHAVAWDVRPNGQVSEPVDLDDMDGFIWNDVNNNGVFAGYVPGDGAAIAWFDEQGALQVQILGKLHPDGGASAVCINDNRMVAGNATYDGLTEGFVWTAETGMVSLGSFNGLGSDVRDINNQGQIVGWSRSDGRFGQVAFLWQNGQMFDLNNITDGGGGQNWIQIANGINDAGHIATLLHVTKPTSENHAALIVPNAN